MLFVTRFRNIGTFQVSISSSFFRRIIVSYIRDFDFEHFCSFPLPVYRFLLDPYLTSSELFNNYQLTFNCLLHVLDTAICGQSIIGIIRFSLGQMRFFRYRTALRNVTLILLVFTSILVTSKLANNSVAFYFKLMLSSVFYVNKNETYAEKPVRNIKTTGVISAQRVPGCVIILRRVNGRLGNILFMFASAYGLAKAHGCLLHISADILKDLHAIFQFNLTNHLSKEHADLLTDQDIVSQHCDCQFDPKLMRPEAVKYFELTGYWQTFGYFIQYLDEIRTLFSFRQSVLRKIFPFIHSILPNTLSSHKHMSFRAIKEYIKQTSPVIWIGIHVRRGDNLNSLQHERGYTVPTVEFLNKAIEYFTRRYKNRVLFIVVSDDKPYCQKIFQNQSNVIVTPDDFSPAADLATMSLCTDAIATCGSYSWWGAVLTGGIVLHDEQFPRKNTPIDTICPRFSYYPPWFLFL